MSRTVYIVEYLHTDSCYWAEAVFSSEDRAREYIRLEKERNADSGRCLSIIELPFNPSPLLEEAG